MQEVLAVCTECARPINPAFGIIAKEDREKLFCSDQCYKNWCDKADHTSG